ncbi:hypothetical protein [Mycobacterium sp. E1747]|uniref:hypothetical protein n=1 Tax=Mycobacterium sp. E1747 TaxID=1834128 RepID=UPI0007FC20BB|nr:hypothetical protein [Mycobacterium sp. E1747]OBH08871.1 hypothetical protein A5695_25575 [Mycobacterium sp. E1747]
MRSYVSLLVTGGGPGAVAVAEIASGFGVDSLVIGHKSGQGPDPDLPAALDGAAIRTLKHHGVLDVLRPFLVRHEPPTLSPRTFEDALRPHCAADLNVTMYDDVELTELRRAEGAEGPWQATISHGKARFAVSAQALIDTSDFPADLSALINAAAARLDALLTAYS